MSFKLTIDVALSSRLRSGDERAFRSVYDQHYRKIYQFANSFLKNKVLTEEVLQETFMQLWLNREQLNPELALEPLLFTICRRLVLDSFRRSASIDRQRQNLLHRRTEEDNKTEEHIVFSDLMRFTERAIAVLPKQQQAVFRLSRFEDMTYEEISAQMNISRNTVKNHLVVALKTLKTVLHGQGVYTILIAWLFS